MLSPLATTLLAVRKQSDAAIHRLDEEIATVVGLP